MDSARYILGFAALVCLVCALLVSGSAVSLRSLQERNAEQERQRNVLFAAGLADPDEELSETAMAERFRAVRAVVVDLETGAELPDADASGVDPLVEAGNQDTSRPAPENPARVRRVERRSVVYLVESDARLDAVVLPVRGQGLWSVLHGFLALEADLNTVRGLTFYEHKETPGLGGEVDNPAWKALWPGRRVFSGAPGGPVIEVARGAAGPPGEDPHRVDGLSGATITSRGVTNLLRFWLDDAGFGPFLERLRAESAGDWQPVEKVPRIHTAPGREPESTPIRGCGALFPQAGGSNRFRESPHRLSRGGGTLPAQIGRASCRERL